MPGRLSLQWVLNCSFTEEPNETLVASSFEPAVRYLTNSVNSQHESGSRTEMKKTFGLGLTQTSDSHATAGIT